jgi:hypothetical protein
MILIRIGLWHPRQLNSFRGQALQNLAFRNIRLADSSWIEKKENGRLALWKLFEAEISVFGNRAAGVFF